MPKMTLQDKLCKALEDRGHDELGTRSSKFRVFQSSDGINYYVGKSGALRKGATSTASLSLTGTTFYDQLLLEAE